MQNKGGEKMNHYDETIRKFLSSLNVDSVNDIKYVGKLTKKQFCICGQAIKYGYVFANTKNSYRCVIGKKCLTFIANYLGWNK